MSKYQRELIRIAPKYNIDLDTSIYNLNDEQMRIIWEGADNYDGINGFFNMLEEGTHKMHYRIMISRYRGYTKCKACGGSRIRTSGRQVFVGGKNIPELINMPFEDLAVFFENLSLNDYDNMVAGQVLNELKWRTNLLVDIGLEYITL